MQVKSWKPLSTSLLMQSHTTCNSGHSITPTSTNPAQRHTANSHAAIPMSYLLRGKVRKWTNKSSLSPKTPSSCTPFLLLLNWFGKSSVRLMERLPAPETGGQGRAVFVVEILCCNVTPVFVCRGQWLESRGNICCSWWYWGIMDEINCSKEWS